MSYTGTMNVEAEAPPLEVVQTDLLTTVDRCDTCGAQAFVQVTFGFSPDNPLLFCGHHFNKAVTADKVKPERDHILNETWKINEKPSASSPD